MAMGSVLLGGVLVGFHILVAHTNGPRIIPNIGVPRKAELPRSFAHSPDIFPGENLWDPMATPRLDRIRLQRGFLLDTAEHLAASLNRRRSRGGWEGACGPLAYRALYITLKPLKRRLLFTADHTTHHKAWSRLSGKGGHSAAARND
jgi:hypothetical protein